MWEGEGGYLGVEYDSVRCLIHPQLCGSLTGPRLWYPEQHDYTLS